MKSPNKLECLSQEDLSTRKPNQIMRVSSFDLLIKIGCFVKKKNIVEKVAEQGCKVRFKLKHNFTTLHVFIVQASDRIKQGILAEGKTQYD